MVALRSSWLWRSDHRVLANKTTSFKTGHFPNQNRPLGIKTGQYPAAKVPARDPGAPSQLVPEWILAQSPA
jgi:hypothetical protein